MRKHGTADKQLESHRNETGRDFMSVDELCSGTWKDVYRFIYYKVGNREEAEDITQETYAKALEFLQRENTRIVNYSNFLKTIAINILRDQWRQNKKRGMVLDIDELNIEEASTEDFTETSARRNMIEAAMNSLNTEQRRVVELRILKGYTAAETAKILQKKEATIRVIQYRALQVLAAVLKEWKQEEEYGK